MTRFACFLIWVVVGFEAETKRFPCSTKVVFRNKEGVGVGESYVRRVCC